MAIKVTKANDAELHQRAEEAHGKMKAMAAKMKPFKTPKQKKGEDDRSHWKRIEGAFYRHGK